MVGKIERIPLREVWKHEAYDFTTWLQDNLDVLNDALDLNLANAEREQSAGTFSVDLVAEDENGNSVVIENQLEKSNHEHLGKLLTYLVAIDARAAVWIVAEPRQEHINVLSWLNESSSGEFYLAKLEAVTIGDSPPAPLVTLIVGPSQEAQDVGKKKKELAERYEIRRRWWTNVLEKAASMTKLHASISPGGYSWIGTSAGQRGLGYNYNVTKHGTATELYIDRGKGTGEQNTALFDALFEHRAEIERDYGGELEWERLDGKQGCRVVKRFTTGGYRSPEEGWDKIQSVQVESMVRLEKALRSHIKQLKTGQSP